ncbi:MAG: glucosyl-3-phosphoglycerate synthase [Actinomycetota bacterium]
MVPASSPDQTPLNQHPTYGIDAFQASSVLAAKDGRSVSVVIPARNEAATIAQVVQAVAAPHFKSAGGTGLVDEIVVVDDGSTDGTGELAREAGARVHVLEQAQGKGQAMAQGLAVSTGDFIVFLDGDVENTHANYLPALLGPLFLHPEVRLVKGFYERPLGGSVTGGGRVTELVARPILELLFPDLKHLLQPLAGETAAARTTLENIGFEEGYKVEMGLLLDVVDAYGPNAVAQVDLGTRIHRNRPIDELRPMAREVLEVALSRHKF